MKAFILVSLFSLSVHAQKNIENSNCTYKIQTNRFGQSFDEIRVLNAGEASMNLHFNSEKDEFVGAGICNDPVWTNKKDMSPIQSVKKTLGNVVTYTFRCGGNLYPTDYFVKISFEKGTDKILSVFANAYIAKWSLPNGAHSGPLKDETDLLKCNSGSTTWKSIVNELKDAGK